MNEILDYRIVAASNVMQLEEKVLKNMNSGWTIWGSIQVFPDERTVRGSLVTQVMVKFAPKKKNSS